jgi:hypothetical protein
MQRSYAERIYDSPGLASAVTAWFPSWPRRSMRRGARVAPGRCGGRPWPARGVEEQAGRLRCQCRASEILLDKLSTSLGWGFSRDSMAVDLRKLALGEPGESTGKHRLGQKRSRHAGSIVSRTTSCSIANAPRTAHGDRSSGPVSLVRQERAGPAGSASDSGRVVFPKRYCLVTTILLGVGRHHATRNPLDPSVGQRPRKPAPGWARPFSPRAFWPQFSWRVSPQPSQPPPSSL